MGYYREFFNDDYDEIGTDDIQWALEADRVDYVDDEYDQIDDDDLMVPGAGIEPARRVSSEGF